MKRFLTPMALVFLLLFAAPVHAASTTTDALARGIELCPQSICGSAIFTGILSGTVAGINTRLGSFIVAVQHEDLPVTAGDTAAITSGAFELRAGVRTVRGVITGGQLVSNGDNTFTVFLDLLSNTGQVLAFQGVLSHNTFPPTIVGHIVSLN
ncbi:MAG TPA: hypothetical protein VNR64_03190 [Vicinamibacterales bacterium]|nr:hypothetical protein [Vicinamibacterales bacterium]